MELRLTRTILERLECSFARQEAKLDQLLGMMATTNTEARSTGADRSSFQPTQCLPQLTQAEQISTPLSTSQPEVGSCLSVDIFQGTPIGRSTVDLDSFLDDNHLSGKHFFRTIGSGNKLFCLVLTE